MNTVFEESFGKVWTDDVTPYLFTKITSMPEKPSLTLHYFKAQLDLSQALFKKHKEVYVIADFAEADKSTREMMCHYYLEFIPKLIRNKVTYIAFVCPHQSFECLPFEAQQQLIHAPTGIFPSFTEALATANLKRSLLLAQKFEKRAVL